MNPKQKDFAEKLIEFMWAKVMDNVRDYRMGRRKLLSIIYQEPVYGFHEYHGQWVANAEFTMRKGKKKRRFRIQIHIMTINDSEAWIIYRLEELNRYDLYSSTVERAQIGWFEDWDQEFQFTDDDLRSSMETNKPFLDNIFTLVKQIHEKMEG